MALHPTDRFFARRHLLETAGEVHADHFDALYLLSEDWVAVGHYFGGDPRWVLGELSIQPTPDEVTRMLQPDWPWTRGGPAGRPEVDVDISSGLVGHTSTWAWSRTASAIQTATPPEIYARMVREIPLEDLRRAASSAANWHRGLGRDLDAAVAGGLSAATDSEAWISTAQGLAAIPGENALTRAQLTYLLTAVLFEKHHAASQVRFKIAKELALTTDLVAALGIQKSQAKVRGWLDGARRLGYLSKHGAGRTAGGLTSLGRTLAARHFPNVLDHEGANS